VEVSLPIFEFLYGSVYLAKPFQNPFNLFLALYLVIKDFKTGILAKFAGKVHAGAATGQLSATVKENPQLPVEDIKVHLFGGSRGVLITPPTCVTYTTIAELTPWSGNAPVRISDSFQVTQGANGRPCVTDEFEMRNAPVLLAGAINNSAGTYLPFVFRLTREDGTQRINRLEATLPLGFSAKLAGVFSCSEAQIAQAQLRSNSEEGKLEQVNPSCPEASAIGSVLAGAGAGPNPLYVQGKVYLAGPYKGVPLSVVVVTPAVAGPFDLGVVVVRMALRLDPGTAQVRAVSDPLPTIFEGIPINLRDIRVNLDRPNFTLNPTSCDPMAIGATVTSALGQVASLSERFQVGGCKSLSFKPKLSLRLKGGTKRGGHPKLRAVLRTKQGPDSKTPEANIKSTVVRLPRSAFLDQAHIGTVCTRVQFAAQQCPSRSVYGHASVKTPLLDEVLSGPVYLRSSSHELPDLVIALKGPDTLPIEVHLAGRVDSLKGAIRTSFESVPDAPVSQFTLDMFGGRKGLIINSRNLCDKPSHVVAQFTGQNGKFFESKPVLKADCKRGGKK
jgi:hypothetical protein